MRIRHIPLNSYDECAKSFETERKNISEQAFFSACFKLHTASVRRLGRQLNFFEL